MTGVAVDDFAVPGTIFQIGIAPNRVDILTALEGVDFEIACRARTQSTYGGVPIGVLSAEDLILNKRAVGRPQDLLDVEALSRALGRSSGS